MVSPVAGFVLAIVTYLLLLAHGSWYTEASVRLEEAHARIGPVHTDAPVLGASRRAGHAGLAG